jgi:hypothetical protein
MGTQMPARAPASVMFAQSDSVLENMWQIPDTCISLRPTSNDFDAIRYCNQMEKSRLLWDLLVKVHTPQALKNAENDFVG